MEPEQESPGKKKPTNHVVLKFALATLIIATLTLVVYETGLARFFLSKKCIANFLESLGPWSSAGFIVIQAFQVVAAPIPGDVTGFLGGYLYGPWLGILYSTIGLTVGSYAAFALSRAFGKPFVKKFVPAASLERFNFLLHHKGAYIVFLLFLLPGVPKDYLCYILGLGELSSVEFLAIGGTGRLFGTVLLTMGGNYIRLRQYVQFGILCGVALVIIFFALAYKDKLERLFRLWHLKAKRRRAKLPAHNGG
ncbi:MAG: VTT domain-containing protein [Syntrophobacteraceae bacterium]